MFIRRTRMLRLTVMSSTILLLLKPWGLLADVIRPTPHCYSGLQTDLAHNQGTFRPAGKVDRIFVSNTSESCTMEYPPRCLISQHHEAAPQVKLAYLERL